MTTTPLPKCHDCGALPGELHDPGCDTEICPDCGGQFFVCCEHRDAPTHPRIPWTGRWPGTVECEEYGFWCTMDPVTFAIGGPCEKDHPHARHDLNRLHTDTVWDPTLRKRVRR